jgi:type I restriction enzyme R subunit
VSTGAPDDNFGFLSDYDREVERLARQAESYVHTDPESCLFKLRLMAETMARRLIEMQQPQLVSTDLATMLRALERSGTMPRPRADDMHAIRRDGNAAVHGAAMPVPAAMRRLRDAHRLAGWFCRMVRRGAKVRLGTFVAPPSPIPADRRAREALEKAEALESEIEQRRHRTREALLLFGSDFEAERDTGRLIDELEALDRVSDAAGEPVVDADSVAIIMAMELQQLLSHPRLGLSSREAQRQAENQLEAVKGGLEERERAYEADRARLAREAMGADPPAAGADPMMPG